MPCAFQISRLVADPLIIEDFFGIFTSADVDSARGGLVGLAEVCFEVLGGGVLEVTEISCLEVLAGGVAGVEFVTSAALGGVDGGGLVGVDGGCLEGVHGARTGDTGRSLRGVNVTPFFVLVLGVVGTLNNSESLGLVGGTTVLPGTSASSDALANRRPCFSKNY